MEIRIREEVKEKELWKGRNIDGEAWLLGEEEDEFVGVEVLTAAVMTSSTLWDITTCSLLKVYRRFGGTCRLHLQQGTKTM
jgi:hypothetical protein